MAASACLTPNLSPATNFCFPPVLQMLHRQEPGSDGSALGWKRALAQIAAEYWEALKDTPKDMAPILFKTPSNDL